MITILRDDEALEDLLGTTIPSDISTAIGYRLVGRAGAGEMFASYYAVRSSPEGDVPVVFKVLRPSFCRQLGETAAVIVKKEAVSLGRLNERVPPTPFVVRLIDVGTLTVRRGSGSIALPWITIEYVHGGAQGTTLQERVQRSIQSSHHAFDPARATRTIECMAKGLAAVHEVGVIHRNVTAGNILCCGAGDEEVFKLSDFGMARPAGLKDTLKGGLLGARGIGPPELLSSKPGAVGPWTDIFSLAVVIYFTLTGEPYFPATTMVEALHAVASRSRRSVLEGRYLHPALRADEQACRSIDFALRWATAVNGEERLQEAEALAAMLTPYLRPAVTAPLLVDVASPSTPPPMGRPLRDTHPVPAPHDDGPLTMRAPPRSMRAGAPPDIPPIARPAPVPDFSAVPEFDRMTIPSVPGVAPGAAMELARQQAPALEGELESSRSSRRLVEPGSGPQSRPRSTPMESWTWSSLHHPGGIGVLRSLAWDGYGRCLAASSQGLLFWNGMTWCPAGSDRLPDPTGIRFVQRVAPGRWLVGGDRSTLAVYTTGGVTGVLQRPGEPERYTSLSGDLEDMGVLAASPPSGPPVLHTFIGRRWLRPCVVTGAAHLTSMARVEHERWLVACRTANGRGMLTMYTPLDWRLEPLPVPDVRAFIACAGLLESGVGVAVGSNGTVVWRTEQGLQTETIEPGRDLSSVALGADESAWAASAGRIWRRRGAGAWQCVWADDTWLAPIISLFVDFGVVAAVSADGGILEGRPSP